MENQGWIKLYRKILDSDIWNDVTAFRLFIYLLLKATHDDIEVNGIKLKKGQWIRSYRNLAKDLAYKEGRGLKEYSINTIHKSIGKLQKAGILTVQETELGTLFTIVNYAKYQDFKDEENKTVNGTVNETVNGTVNNNKNAINKNAINKNNIYTPKIKDLLGAFSNKIPGFIELNKKYWDVIRETRKTGKVSESVIYNNMKKWEKYNPVVIQYALTAHIMKHAGKREEYTLGIMRRTNEHEARRELIKLNNKGGVRIGNNQTDNSEKIYDYGF